MECAQVTEEQRLWTETQIQKAKHNAWPSCLASVYLTEITRYCAFVGVRSRRLAVALQRARISSAFGLVSSASVAARAVERQRVGAERPHTAEYPCTAVSSRRATNSCTDPCV